MYNSKSVTIAFCCVYNGKPALIQTTKKLPTNYTKLAEVTTTLYNHFVCTKNSWLTPVAFVWTRRLKQTAELFLRL